MMKRSRSRILRAMKWSLRMQQLRVSNNWAFREESNKLKETRRMMMTKWLSWLLNNNSSCSSTSCFNSNSCSNRIKKMESSKERMMKMRAKICRCSLSSIKNPRRALRREGEVLGRRLSRRVNSKGDSSRWFIMKKILTPIYCSKWSLPNSNNNMRQPSSSSKCKVCNRKGSRLSPRRRRVPPSLLVGKSKLTDQLPFPLEKAIPWRYYSLLHQAAQRTTSLSTLTQTGVRARKRRRGVPRNPMPTNLCSNNNSNSSCKCRCSYNNSNSKCSNNRWCNNKKTKNRKSKRTMTKWM